MSDHFGNFRVHGKVLSDSISGSDLVITSVDATTIDVATLLINGTEFDPQNINITGSFDDSAIQVQIDAISGAVDSNTSDISDLNNYVSSFSIESSGGSITVSQDGYVWNLEVVSVSGGGPTPPHNNLVGLQGGNGSSQYYHLTLAQYNDYIGSTEVASISAGLQSQNMINAGDITGLESGVAVISGAVDLNTTNISTNAANIATNVSDISDLQDQVNSIQVSAGGGSLPMEINSGLTSNFVITETGRENYVGFNTSTGTYTVTMNATPEAGDKVYVVDENMNAFTNNITVDGNGNNINCCATYLLNFNNAGVVFVFAGGSWRAIRN